MSMIIVRKMLQVQFLCELHTIYSNTEFLSHEGSDNVLEAGGMVEDNTLVEDNRKEHTNEEWYSKCFFCFFQIQPKY